MMKLGHLAFGAALALASLTATPSQACDGHDGNAKAAPKKAPAEQLKTATFHVEGMSCEGCGDKVKTALASLDAVYKVDVKTADKRVTVDYDAKKISPDKISKIITEKTGYKAAPEA